MAIPAQVLPSTPVSTLMSSSRNYWIGRSLREAPSVLQGTSQAPAPVRPNAQVARLFDGFIKDVRRNGRCLAIPERGC